MRELFCTFLWTIRVHVSLFASIAHIVSLLLISDKIRSHCITVYHSQSTKNLKSNLRLLDLCIDARIRTLLISGYSAIDHALMSFVRRLFVIDVVCKEDE